MSPPPPPRAAVLQQHCSFGEEIVPNVQPEPLLLQLEAITSRPVAVCWEPRPTPTSPRPPPSSLLGFGMFCARSDAVGGAPGPSPVSARPETQSERLPKGFLLLSASQHSSAVTPLKIKPSEWSGRITHASKRETGEGRREGDIHPEPKPCRSYCPWAAHRHRAGPGAAGPCRAEPCRHQQVAIGARGRPRRRRSLRAAGPSSGVPTAPGPAGGLGTARYGSGPSPGRAAGWLILYVNGSQWMLLLRGAGISGGANGWHSYWDYRTKSSPLPSRASCPPRPGLGLGPARRAAPAPPAALAGRRWRRRRRPWRRRRREAVWPGPARPCPAPARPRRPPPPLPRTAAGEAAPRSAGAALR